MVIQLSLLLTWHDLPSSVNQFGFKAAENVNYRNVRSSFQQTKFRYGFIKVYSNVLNKLYICNEYQKPTKLHLQRF